MARRPSPQTLAVVGALADRAGEWSHGYDLCRTLGLKAGTVYPIMMRLAERGLVERVWEQDAPPGRPARHLYRLSAAGMEFARASLAPVLQASVAARRPSIRTADA